MGLFGGTDPTSARFDALMEELTSLKRSVAEIKGERAAGKRVIDLEREYASTKRELTDLQIEFDREKERHAREKREVEHLVGLERKRSDFEREAAIKEAKVTVREENLAAQTERFEEQMSFITTRFEKEVGYVKEIMADVLARLPKTETLIKLSGGNGATEKKTALEVE